MSWILLSVLESRYLLPSAKQRLCYQYVIFYDFLKFSLTFLQLEPYRWFQVMRLPLHATRIVTDPFVDFFSFLFVEIFLPWLTSALRAVFQVVVFFALYFVRILLGNGVATWIPSFSLRVVSVHILSLNPL